MIQRCILSLTERHNVIGYKVRDESKQKKTFFRYPLTYMNLCKQFNRNAVKTKTIITLWNLTGIGSVVTQTHKKLFFF